MRVSLDVVETSRPAREGFFLHKVILDLNRFLSFQRQLLVFFALLQLKHKNREVKVNIYLWQTAILLCACS